MQGMYDVFYLKYQAICFFFCFYHLKNIFSKIISNHFKITFS